MKVPVIAIFPFLFQGPLMIPWLASEGKVISGEMSSSEEKEIVGSQQDWKLCLALHPNLNSLFNVYVIYKDN